MEMEPLNFLSNLVHFIAVTPRSLAKVMLGQLAILCMQLLAKLPSDGLLLSVQ